MRMRIEQAGIEEWAAITALVRDAQLPLAGLEHQFPEAYAVAWDAERVVGVAGLQPHGLFGLLRSVVVSPTSRGAGIGRALVLERLAAARDLGLKGVYLLTTSAAEWFLGLGFEPADRASAPASLLASPEFVHACPASATCLSSIFSRI